MASVNADLGNSTAYAEAIAILIRKGGTTRDVSEHSGLAYNTCRKLIRALHRRKLLRVALWGEDSAGRKRIPVWLMGSGPDAARPPRMTEDERKQRYNAKRREIADRLGIPVRGLRLRDYKEHS